MSFTLFQLQARDRDRPDLTSTAIVNVNIIDTNDNAPQFTRPTANFFIMENATVDTYIGNISVSVWNYTNLLL